jgi:hypothetical protein
MLLQWGLTKPQWDKVKSFWTDEHGEVYRKLNKNL